jgi:hypothetical protein
MPTVYRKSGYGFFKYDAGSWHVTHYDCFVQSFATKARALYFIRCREGRPVTVR